MIKWVQEGKRLSREEITDMGSTMGKPWNKFSALSLVDRILYRNFEDEKGETAHFQLCLPWKLVKEALESTHDIPSAGHLGSQIMTEVIKKRFYWSGWRSDVEAHCRNCQKCGAESPVRGALVLEHSGYSMERVAIDVVRLHFLTLQVVIVSYW